MAEHDPNKIANLAYERAKREREKLEPDSFIYSGEQQMAKIDIPRGRDIAADVLNEFTPEKLEENFRRHQAFTDASNYLPNATWEDSLDLQRESVKTHETNTLLIVLEQYMRHEDPLGTWVYAVAEELRNRYPDDAS